jgi:hypothetical protein
MSLVRSVAVCILWLIFLSACSSMKNGKASDTNCAIDEPPAGAGEDAAHKTLLKIFPRNSDMGAAYSGCQTVWVRDGNSWAVLMIGVFENGEVTQMKFPSEPGNAVEQCVKRSGALVKGNTNVCHAMDAFPYSSAPPGCLSCLSRASEKTKGDSCSYD